MSDEIYDPLAEALRYRNRRQRIPNGLRHPVKQRGPSDALRKAFETPEPPADSTRTAAKYAASADKWAVKQVAAPPCLTAAIKAARSDVRPASDQPRFASNTVPEPPDLAAAIRAARSQE